MDLSDHYDLLCSVFTFLKDYAHVEDYEQVCARLLDSLVELIRSASARQAGRNAHKKAGSKDLMAQIKQYVDQHYREKLTARDIASVFFISEGHLLRQFKNFTGHTLKQYITDKRMGEARRMLIFSDLSIKDVAVSCGYSDIQYFYHIFKRSAGCTPAEYRKNFSE